MAQQTPGQARVIDPLLTEVARGWKQPAEFVAEYLFPTVLVGARAGKIVTFGREDFLLYSTQRAPGERTKRVQFGYAGSPFALTDFSLEGLVAKELLEEGRAVPNIDQVSLAIGKVQRIMALERENLAAQLARASGNYPAGNKVTLSGTSQWSDVANSDPIADVALGREAIRAATGRYPDLMEIGPAVFTALKKNAKIIDRMKYTGRDVPTLEILQGLFEIPKIVVGQGIYLAGESAATFTDIWGKDAILAFTETGSMRDMGTPCYGYTYQLVGYPFAEQMYDERNAKSFIYPYTDARQPVMAGPSAGYLIINAVA